MRLADFTSHRIEGIAKMGNVSFSAPLFSQIDGNIWCGGCPVGRAPDELKFIVSLYLKEPYDVGEHVILLKAGLYDSTEIPNEKTMIALAHYINDVRQIAPTLVHCQAGLNRSPLLVALALMESGIKAQDAIDLLRTKRCEAVLCNQAFENWLLNRDKLRIG